MISAADTPLLIAAEEQGRAAVRAPVIEDPDPAGGITEGNQLFTQQHQAHRIAVCLEFIGFAGRNPELPHEVTHERSTSYPDEGFVICNAEHKQSPSDDGARIRGLGDAGR